MGSIPSPESCIQCYTIRRRVIYRRVFKPLPLAADKGERENHRAQSTTYRIPPRLHLELDNIYAQRVCRARGGEIRIA